MFRPTCSKRESSLRIDRSKSSLFQVRFLFDQLKGCLRSLTTNSSWISLRQGSNGNTAWLAEILEEPVP